MSSQLRQILDKVNKTEVYLQELELLLLSQQGIQSNFEWNNLFKGVKTSPSNESVIKLSNLIESSEKARKKIRNLGLECLSLQLAIENLDRLSDQIEKEAREIEQKLSKDGIARPLSRDSKSDVLQAIISSGLNGNGSQIGKSTITTN